MEWTKRVMEAVETTRAVRSLIDKGFKRVAKELSITHDKKESLQFIATADQEHYLVRQDAFVIHDAIVLNHNKVLNKLLQRNRTLKGLTEERVYKIIKEMILEETESFKGISSNNYEEMIKIDGPTAVQLLKRLDSIHDVLITLNNSLQKPAKN